MQNLVDNMKLDLVLEPWAFQMVAIILLTLFLNITIAYLLKYLRKASGLTNTRFDDAIICSAESPLTAVIWIIAAKFCLNITDKYIKIIDADIVNSTSRIAIILCFAWFLMSVIKYVTKETLNAGKIAGKEVDQTTIDALSKLARLIVSILTILIIMQDVGFNISGILAAGGVGGIIIGFAAKDLIANFFGGLTIYLDRPFIVGDWIRCDEKKIEGIVEYIGWRHTRIRAFNKNPIYVPNGLFTTVVVENPSRMSHRRINETIGLRYSDIGKIEVIIAQIKEALNCNQEIDHEQSKLVNFERFGENGLEISIYALTKNTDLERFIGIKQQILLQIAKIIAENEAEIAFPTRTLYVKNDLRA